MSVYKPGDAVHGEFVTNSLATGAATDADFAPVGTLTRNGTDDGAVTVQVLHQDTGRYHFFFTIPATYAAGDSVVITINATLNAILAKAVVWSEQLRAHNTDDLYALLAAMNPPPNWSALNIDLSGRMAIQSRITKNTALSNFLFLMNDGTGNALPGLNVTATRTIDGSAPAACANTVTEVGSGYYKINLAASDLNGNCIGLKFSAAGAKDSDITIVTVP